MTTDIFLTEFCLLLISAYGSTQVEKIGLDADIINSKSAIMRI